MEKQVGILIRGCRAGDRSCQNKLYAQYSGKMMSVCLRYVSNREEAEDILQEGFLKVFVHIHEFKNQGSFEGWMRKIMVNTALERYRKKPHLYPVIRLEDINEINIATEEILSRINVKELINMIQKLPPGYRMVFNLHVFEGLKHREIAQKLGISEGTSKSNLSDARTILQKRVINSLKIAKQGGDRK